MKVLLSLLITLISSNIAYASKDDDGILHRFQRKPAAIVFNYECKQLNEKNAGITCRKESGNPLVLEIADGLDIDKNETLEYLMSDFILRYQSLGGSDFDIVYPKWGDGTVGYCKTREGMSLYSCVVCKIGADGCTAP